MGIMADAKADILNITTNTSEFAVPIIFTANDGIAATEDDDAIPPTTVTCNGIAIRHSLVLDDMGVPTKGTTARVTISEQALVDLDYPTRSSGVIILKNNLVTWTDVDGYTITYQIKGIYPGNTVGIIVCTLGIFI